MFRIINDRMVKKNFVFFEVFDTTKMDFEKISNTKTNWTYLCHVYDWSMPSKVIISVQKKY